MSVPQPKHRAPAPSVAVSAHRALPPKGSNPFFTLVRMLGYHKIPLLIATVLSLIEAVLGLFQPLLINRVIDGFNDPDFSLRPFIIALISLMVFSTLSGGFMVFLLTRTAESAVLGTRRQLIARMLRLPISYYDTHHTGDLVTRIGSDTTLIRSAFSGGLVHTVGAVLTMVGSIVLMALIDWVMLLVVVFVIALCLVAVVIASGRIQKATRLTQRSVGRLGGGMERALLASRTIRASGESAQRRIETKLDEDALEAFSHGRTIAIVQGILAPVSGLSLQGAFLAVLGIGGVRVATGSMSIGDLVAFILYLFMVITPLATIFDTVTTIRSAMGALERVNQVMDVDEEDRGGTPLLPVANAPAVEFRAVSFSYDVVSDDTNAETSTKAGDGEPQIVSTPQVLHDVSFSIASGSTTALVGPSGSGKTTILSLIERFYDPDSGEIFIDGAPASTTTRQSLRSRIGYVEQEPAILSGTVRANLQLGNEAATDEQCWKALEQVNMAERFRADRGLDSLLGERGITLSGGQRQRLALARMLLMESPILLLDEPTSAVDSHNEELILQAVNESSKDRTVIVIAHRLSTVTDSDQIIVIEDGQVHGVGTHRELMDGNDTYRSLAQRQLLS